jgi:hypothetical protein
MCSSHTPKTTTFNSYSSKTPFVNILFKIKQIKTYIDFNIFNTKNVAVKHFFYINIFAYIVLKLRFFLMKLPRAQVFRGIISCMRYCLIVILIYVPFTFVLLKKLQLAFINIDVFDYLPTTKSSPLHFILVLNITTMSGVK